MSKLGEDKDLQDIESHEFEERADYLPESYITDRTAKSQFFDDIQKKLIQVGAKLLIGPRGTGKTHHMRCAYISCKNDISKPLPIYVTFNHYLRLETYINESSNAIGIFHAWVLAKIAVSCMQDYTDERKLDDFTEDDLKLFIGAVEKQQYSSDFDNIINSLSVSKVQEFIQEIMHRNSRKRAVLLLDDAALTLTPEYMAEFFEVFRSLKSAYISPKASVYPGSTQYGPRFHLGHDAEPVHVWLSVENPKYLEFMTSLTEQRFSSDISIPSEILDLFKYAAFGIPRAFIMMVRSYAQISTGSSQVKFNRIIEERRKYILAEYLSIAEKLMQYKGVINLGEEFLNSIVELLKKANHDNLEKDNLNFEKVIAVGIADIPNKADRMIRFLIEAGLLYEAEPISHGVDRKLRRFIPHISFLLAVRAFTKSKGFNAGELLTVLKGKSAKHPIRPSFATIIPSEKLSKLNLDLPPCTVCKATRLTEKQKFCHQCGAPLVDHSTFRNCMAKPLSELPLSDFQKRAIKEKTSFVTVEDVIMSQDPASELQKAKFVKTARANAIYGKINAWINEFLV
ncbi:hypothetical protein [Rheinheimera oceanensis]|uniref:hypothetical protein n=1 Tax=Rheinheimera oceanensis TaxID=2817449 RepID=UPI001BFCE396|nr:hypothetical protein [Rheinheimera oceanensis]